MAANLHLVPPPSRSEADQFDERARLRCRALRAAIFKSQIACAEDFRIGHSTVKRYENGTSRIPAGYLLRLEARAKDCGVTVAEPTMSRAA